MARKKTANNVTGLTYKKSNIIIAAKYKSSLMENKILAVALYNLQNISIPPTGDITVEMSAAQLKEMFGTGNSIYSHLKPLAANLTGRTVGIENDSKKEFHYMSIVTNADYVNGVFTITFNNRLRNQLTEIQNKFTMLSLPMMMGMESVYSFRLYELLKSEAFVGNRFCQQTMNGFEFYIGLSELKLELGVIDASEKKVKEILNGKEKPDYDKAVEAASEQRYSEWRDFKRYVIDVAVKDITAKTDMTIEYKPRRAGKGGKTVGLNFTIEYKNPIDESDVIDEIVEKKITEEEKYELIDKVKDLITEKISTKDAIAILDASNYDFEKIIVQYENSKKANKIENLVGWLIKAIKNEYRSGIKKTNNSFNNFEMQNEYDYDELEKVLLDN